MHLPRLSLVFAGFATLLAPVLRAQTTWIGGTDSSWNTAANWSPASVPNSTATAAVFNAASGANSISISANFSVDTLSFTSDALANTFTLTSGGALNFYGNGIENASSATPTFANSGTLTFANTASAGSASITDSGLGGMNFNSNSTAGSASITHHGSGSITFYSHSTAGSATLIVANGYIIFLDNSSAGSASLTNASTVNFNASSTAGSATITNNHSLSFNDMASAGSAVITNNNYLSFNNSSTPDSAVITNSAGSTLDFSNRTLPTASLGSLSGDGTVSLGGTNLSVGGLNTTTTYDGVIDDQAIFTGVGGTLTKVGTGTLTLTNAANTFSFAQINGGTLALTSGATLGYNDGTVQVTVDNGGTLDLGGNTLAFALVALTNGTVKNGTIDASTGSISLSAGTLSATLTGAGAVIKDTSGAVVLSGTNDYSGGTTINGGLIEFSSAANFGTGPITIDGGGLRWATGTTADITTWSQLSRTIGAGGATFDTNGNVVTFTAGFDGEGAFTKAGTGGIKLTGANTNTGGTIISAGTLQLRGSGALGSGAVTIGSSGVLDFEANTTASAATIANSGNLFFGDNATASSAAITGAGFIGFYDHSSAGSATITTSGTTNFQDDTTAGSATITNNGFMGFLGNSTAGTANITNNSNLTLRGTSPGSATIVNHATLSLYSTGGTPTITNNATIYLLNTGTADGATIINNAPGGITLMGLTNSATAIGALSGDGSIDLFGKTLTVGALNTDTTLSGTIGDFLHTGTFAKTGTGTLILSGTNTYAGATSIDGGTLKLGSVGALPSGLPLTLSGTGILDLNGNAATLSALTGASGTAIALTGATLTVAQAGSTTFAGVLSGTGSLIKSNSGSLELTGSNVFSGATTVSAGTLFVNGSLTQSALTVNSGATLGGSGTLGALATIASGGHLAPGNSPGTITFSQGLTLTAGAILDFQLGTTSDLVHVSGGTLTGPSGTGALTLNISSASGFAAGIYSLFDFAGAGTVTNFDATDFALGTTIPGYDFNLATNGTTNVLELTATASAIPEPATCAAIFGALALGTAGLRRRWRAL